MTTARIGHRRIVARFGQGRKSGPISFVVKVVSRGRARGPCASSKLPKFKRRWPAKTCLVPHSSSISANGANKTLQRTNVDCSVWKALIFNSMQWHAQCSDVGCFPHMCSILNAIRVRKPLCILIRQSAGHFYLGDSCSCY